MTDTNITAASAAYLAASDAHRAALDDFADSEAVYLAAEVAWEAANEARHVANEARHVANEARHVANKTFDAARRAASLEARENADCARAAYDARSGNGVAPAIGESWNNVLSAEAAAARARDAARIG